MVEDAISIYAAEEPDGVVDDTTFAAATSAGIDRVCRVAGRMQRPSGGGHALRETDLETIGRRAGLVREGLQRTTGILLKMMERARERVLTNLT